MKVQKLAVFGVENMKIINKQESIKIIETLKLNVFPNIIVTGKNQEQILKFIDENKSCKFAIRDIKNSMSKKFRNNLSYDDLKSEINNLNDCVITVSGLTFKEHKLLSGEICIDKDLNLVLAVSSDKDFSARDAAMKPEFYINTTLFEKEYRKVPNIELVLDYIIKNSLFNVIVEFTVFDMPVGNNCENVIIWELRTKY